MASELTPADLTSTPVLYPEKPLAEGVFVVSVVFSVLSTAVLALRLWARVLTPGQRFKADDWTAIAAWPFVIGVGIESALLCRHGYGLHLPQVIAVAPGNVTYGLKVLYAGYVTYNVAIVIVRISATLFYRRLFSNPTNNYDRWVWVAIALNIIWFLGSELAAILECSPVWEFWVRSPGAKCLETLDLQLGSGITSVFLDLFVLIMPLPMIWKLQLNRTRKTLLFATFILGYGVVVLSIGRLVTVAKLGDSLNTDITWSFVDVNIWLELETAIAHISICLPPSFPLIRRVKEGGFAALFHRGQITAPPSTYAKGSATRKYGLHSQRAFKKLSGSGESTSVDEMPLHNQPLQDNQILVTTDIELGHVPR